MMSRVINVFKCIVNISSQDFGVYFRGKANFGVGSKAEQHGDSDKAVNDESGVVMEAGWMVGEDVGWFWALVTFLDAGEWVAELRSLLGWLWRQWVFKLEGRRKFGSEDDYGSKILERMRYWNQGSGGVPTRPAPPALPVPDRSKYLTFEMDRGGFNNITMLCDSFSAAGYIRGGYASLCLAAVWDRKIQFR